MDDHKFACQKRGPLGTQGVDTPFAREFVSEKPYSTKTYFVQQHCRAKIYKQNETSNIP